MFKNNRKFINAMIITAALATPISLSQYCHPTYVRAVENSDQNTDTNRTVSVQKLYANVYDQSTGRFLGRYLLDIENGYTDSPQRMFSYSQLPQIVGYEYTSNAPVVSVDWSNPSGITEMKVYAVKKSAAPYQNDHSISSAHSSSHHSSQEESRHNNVTANSNQSQKSSNSSNSNSSEVSSNSIKESSSASSSSVEPKLNSAKNESKPRKTTKAKVDKTKVKQKSNNLPVILISSIVLVIAIVAIIWGAIKIRKPRKVHKHQKNN